ncbi:hypothetical protein Pfo_008390 [Paulownia fortunei]|nr:hypothetical protein Pfo_008390 [Paulownia fortunei]
MNWVQRKIYLYNVTFGLYMLDWWERFLFNTLVVVLMWFVCYNGVRYASEFCRSECTCGLALLGCNGDDCEQGILGNFWQWNLLESEVGESAFEA